MGKRVNPPNNILLSYSLYPKGTIEIGYESYKGGMSVGTTQIVARLQIPEDCGSYPNGWFPLEKKSMHSVKAELERELSKDGATLFLPSWILLDCYRYHWEVLQREVKGGL